MQSLRVRSIRRYREPHWIVRIAVGGQTFHMIRLAANLSFLFTELPFLKRFEAAARAGFRAVEFTFAYDVPTPVLKRQLCDNDLKLVLINTPAGDMEAGEMGLSALPGRERDAMT